MAAELFVMILALMFGLITHYWLLTTEHAFDTDFGFALWIILYSFVGSVQISCLTSDPWNFRVWDSLGSVCSVMLVADWLEPTSPSGFKLNSSVTH